MDLTALIAQLTDSKATLQTTTAQVTDLTAQLAAAKTSAGEKDAKIADLQAQLETAKATTPADVATELETTKASLSTVSTFIADHAKAALALAGVKELPADLPGQIEVINKAKVQLSHLPVGGVAAAATAVDGVPKSTPAVAAFKTTR